MEVPLEQLQVVFVLCGPKMPPAKSPKACHQQHCAWSGRLARTEMPCLLQGRPDRPPRLLGQRCYACGAKRHALFRVGAPAVVEPRLARALQICSLAKLNLWHPELWQGGANPFAGAAVRTSSRVCGPGREAATANLAFPTLPKASADGAAAQPLKRARQAVVLSHVLPRAGLTGRPASGGGSLAADGLLAGAGLLLLLAGVLGPAVVLRRKKLPAAAAARAAGAR